MPAKRIYSVLLVAAHPDDEVIGAGAQLTRWPASAVTIVHLTDGSPRSISFAQNAGFETREEYAHARRRELYCALDLVGIRPDQCFEFKYVDQEAWLHLPEIVDRLAALVTQLKPDAVYTHPYEGGHPDHDAAAFAVAQLEHRNAMEFTSYHRADDSLVTGEFLGAGDIETLALSENEARIKGEMYRCFGSQQKVLGAFPIVPEKFRPAPHYDFSQPPTSFELHYETLGWDITGQQWREQAREALELLSTRRRL